MNQKEIFDIWKKDFVIATQFDQAKETANAIATYKTILNGIAKFVDADVERNSHNLQLKETANKIIHCLKNRVVVLSKSSEQQWPTLEEILKLKPVFNNFYKWKKVFPVLIITEEIQNSVTSNKIEMKELQPPLEKNSLYQRFALDLQSIGLKYPRCLLNPFLSISLRDADSVLLTPVVNTPILKTINDYHYLLNYRVNVQMYLEKVPRLSAVFFEMKHTFENRQETKYFTFLSHEFFKCTNVFLEIYKGPVDYHRKMLRKMTTTKPLYLHLAIKMVDA